jgi:hypothetical protein
MNIETRDEIYEIILKRIIWEPDPVGHSSHTKQCAATSFELVPQAQSQSFNINTDDLQVSPAVSKQIEESKQWGKLYGRVSPETYTARVILFISANRRIPIFLSKTTFRIKQFIMNTEETRFISPKIREEIIRHYCKFKRTYWGFAQFAKIWKVRRTPVRIQTDLYMNELDTNHRNTFQLVHTNGIYLFSLQNLARIIVDAITHQSGMFVEPLPIKNPYTNSLLSKCDLFNIYFSLRYHHIRIHEMLERFFRCEFNMFEFHRKYVSELRDFAIEQYVKSANVSELSQDLDDMLRMHKMTNKIVISPGFPKKQLVDTMRPLLRLYLFERYSFSSMTRNYSAKQLDCELRKFRKTNPLYGGQIKLDNNECIYITETKPYTGYCVSKYMQTHIYNEETFERYLDTGDSIETYSEESISSSAFDFDYYRLIHSNTNTTIQIPVPTQYQNRNIDADIDGDADADTRYEPETPTPILPPTPIATENREEEQPSIRTAAQIQASGLVILNRLARTSLLTRLGGGLQTRPGVSFLGPMVFNQSGVNLLNRSIMYQSPIPNQPQANDSSEEQDEDEEEEEVINNTEDDDEDESEVSDLNWDEYDDGEDSVS